MGGGGGREGGLDGKKDQAQPLMVFHTKHSDDRPHESCFSLVAVLYPIQR